MSDTTHRNWREILSYLKPPLEWLYENVGVVRPKLVATLKSPVFWRDPKDPEDDGVREIVTFFLLEFQSGRRTYKVHDYGYAEQKDYAEQISADVVAWTMGGPLPRGAKRIGEAEIIQLTCIDTQKN